MPDEMDNLPAIPHYSQIIELFYYILQRQYAYYFYEKFNFQVQSKGVRIIIWSYNNITYNIQIMRWVSLFKKRILMSLFGAIHQFFLNR